jgi:transposase
VVQSAGIDRQTLRDGLQRCDASGLPGLGHRYCGGAPPRLSPEQEVEAANWIRRRPNVEVDGVLRWRCLDIQARIAHGWDATLHARSISNLRHRLRFARVSTRSCHPKAGAMAQVFFGSGSSPL